MKKLWIVLLAMSRTVLLSIAGALTALLLMIYRLASLTPGLSTLEIATYSSTNSLTAIINDPVNAPYKLAVYISTLFFDSAFGLRLTGAIIGALSIIIFYLIARRIFNDFVALGSTAMFASSSLLLAMSRTATPMVMLLSLLAITGVGFYIRFEKRTDIGWILAAIILGLSLYVPGMIIFITAAAAWQFKHIKKAFERLQTPIIVASSVIFGLLCAPLLVSLIREPSLWRDYLGLPLEFAAPMDMLRFAGTSLASLFAVAPNDNILWLGRQPVLDVFATAMFAYGICTLVIRYKLDRLWTLGGIFLLGALWIAITGNRYGILLLLPFVYLIVGIGMQSLISKWMKVFPKNPIARYVGTILLGATILLALNFQLHRYFVAWSNNKEVKQNFSHQLSDTRQ